MSEYVENYDGEYDSNALYVKQITDEQYKLAPAKPGDIGMDLPVRVKGVKLEPDVVHAIDGSTCKSIYIYDDHFFIPAGGSAEIPCGIHAKVPDNAWGNIKARSSTGWKKRLNVFEGIIDSGYVGPLYILVFNPTDKPVRVNEGDRLAQFIIVPAANIERILEVDEMPSTERGETGFGSTNG